MAEGKHRLSKVAKELNVSVSTITDFLKTQGHTVESNPNAKITDEQYDAVLKEYEGEKKVKAEAKQLQTDKAAAAPPPPAPVAVAEPAKPVAKKKEEEVAAPVVKEAPAEVTREKT